MQQAFYTTLAMCVAKEMVYANMPLGKTATKIYLMKQAVLGCMVENILVLPNAQLLE